MTTKYRLETRGADGAVKIIVFYPEDSTEIFRESKATYSSHDEAEKNMGSEEEILPNFDHLPADPYNEGWVGGYGVIRKNPWHFGGIYDTKEKADYVAVSLGGDYEVEAGSHRINSSDFITESKNHSAGRIV